MEKEIWKDIQGYEGLYQVSNYGRVKNKKGKIMSLGGNRYYTAPLTEKGITKYLSVHRLVAQAFIPNPNNLKQVNHIDFNRKNNYVDNLEWVSQRDNLSYSMINGRYAKWHIKVYEIKNGIVVEEYPSVSFAARKHNIKRCVLYYALKTKYSYKINEKITLIIK